MNCLPIIEAKRDGQQLSPEQINSLVASCVAGRCPDYQLAALLMAIYFQGLDFEETRSLTLAMRDSGQILSFPPDPRPLVSKHSTGGVGDKISLILVPLLASLGCRIPKISGRGLGITGGTLDKLESIPRFTTAIAPEQIIHQVQEIGCVICAQSATLVPADKILYAIRDVTGTVGSAPLVAASILSKKLAENVKALVLDVKFGSAAFMPTLDKARDLAQVMVKLGSGCGLGTSAFLTNMDSPLGRTAGNWLEVKEAVACLQNHGPEDVRDLAVEFAAELLVQTAQVPTLLEGRERAIDALRSGAAMQRWRQMLAAQGADLGAYDKKLSREVTAPYALELECTRSGFVRSCSARVIGEVVRDLGGGRLRKESTPHLEVGVDHLARPGDPIKPGSTLARVHAADPHNAHRAIEQIKNAFTFSDDPLPPSILISERIGSGSVDGRPSAG